MLAPTMYYTVTQHHLNEQLSRIDQLDAKVATLYATASGSWPSLLN